MITERLIEALDYARTKHKGQTRKGSGLAYVTHPFAVSYILCQYKKSSKKMEDLLIACIIHDCLEDTSAYFEEIVKKFGALVGSLVLELTNDPDEIAKIGKLAYHKKKLVGISSYALSIKLADRLHNMRDNPSEKMVSETFELMRHLTDHRHLSKTQTALVNDIFQECFCRMV